MARPIYIHDFAVLCALGSDTETVRRTLLAPEPPRVSGVWTLTDGHTVPVGAVTMAALPDDPDSRCNAMANRCLAEIDPALWNIADKSRLAVVMGTSSCGLRENGAAFQHRLAEGAWPADFRLALQEFGNVAAHIAERTGAMGPTYGISTACTSGAKALASGARLIQSGMADVVIAGGFDALCDLTLNGFSSLEALDNGVSNPFSANRHGINLGEGGALFVLSAEPSPVRLAGWGESADAYHISAPDPEGNGAEAAMREAMERAGLKPEDIGYLNLHGTGTKLNDLMEARAVTRVFGNDLPCSTTKPLTGHMLGAAGAGEAAFTIMALQAGRLPGNAWDGERDPEMPPIRLVSPQGETTAAHAAMSCSYAFGGNNIALVLEVSR
jgi:3-oxoacyl-[acyl-carrier-protein] synthase-1